MAITGTASYLPTTDEFLAHWEMANQAPEGPIELRGGLTWSALNSLRNTLANQRTQLTQKLNAREFARGDITAQAAALVQRLEQFNARVRVLFEAGSKYVNALPKVPNPESAADKVTTPLDDAANIWMRIDEGGQTILLGGGYTLQAFNEAIAELKESYRAFTKARTEEKIARGARNETQAQIYPLLKQYREVIPTYFAADSSFVETLPRLRPKPGSTPNPVNASAVWDPGENKARIAWEASDNTSLKEYQVRYTPGPRYDEDDASVVATTQPSEPREVRSDAGLTQPGAESSFKVFVITDTGNEAGSDALTVERPEETVPG
jgi:prefoldin subunit 5